LVVAMVEEVPPEKFPAEKFGLEPLAITDVPRPLMVEPSEAGAVMTMVLLPDQVASNTWPA
jgi:hypothetical protein